MGSSCGFRAAVSQRCGLCAARELNKLYTQVSVCTKGMSNSYPLSADLGHPWPTQGLSTRMTSGSSQDSITRPPPWFVLGEKLSAMLCLGEVAASYARRLRPLHASRCDPNEELTCLTQQHVMDMNGTHTHTHTATAQRQQHAASRHQKSRAVSPRRVGPAMHGARAPRPLFRAGRRAPALAFPGPGRNARLSARVC